jgi:outer membrane receptor protein involved in Fe transport
VPQAFALAIASLARLRLRRRRRPADAAPADAGRTIVVTGSRIASPNLTSTAPITNLTSEDIKLQGTTKTEDLLNSLPQVFAAQSSTLANGATGTATVDLRGLGASRTLVLVNGRRLMPGDVTSSAADLNFMPASLVKRVDVLTGGASATYGADAVAGVVNFVLDTEFTGLRVDANYGLPAQQPQLSHPVAADRTNQGLSGWLSARQRADGGNFDTTISFGTKFADGQGHAMAYFGYRKVNPILQSKRDYSACTVQNANKTTLQCGGSATSATGNILFTPAGSSSSTFGALGPGTLTPNASTRYNFAPLNYFQRPDERYTAGAFVDYEVNSAIHPYMEFMFMDDRTVAQIAPSGDFGNTLTINCDNPMMSASQKAQICNPSNLIVGYVGNYPLTPAAIPTFTARLPRPRSTRSIRPPARPGKHAALLRNVEGGPRQSDLEHQAFRTLIGSRGELGKGWSYDAYYQYGRVNYSRIYTTSSRLRADQCARRCHQSGQWPDGLPLGPHRWRSELRSLQRVQRPGLAGCAQLPQRFGLPAWPHHRAGAQRPADRRPGPDGHQGPLASDGISIALGVEHRRESLDLKTDNEFQTGDLTGQGAPTLSVSGSYKVTEFISEAEVPLVRMLHLQPQPEPGLSLLATACRTARCSTPTPGRSAPTSLQFAICVSVARSTVRFALPTSGTVLAQLRRPRWFDRSVRGQGADGGRSGCLLQA